MSFASSGPMTKNTTPTASSAQISCSEVFVKWFYLSPYV
jgi:hypothetical protein